jgi:GNAT superfamily N-acetyltransferase
MTRCAGALSVNALLNSDEEIMLSIRPAQATDVPQILSFIKALALYERAPHEVLATEASLQASLFGATPQAQVLLCFNEQVAVGFAVYFYSYYTWLGRKGIYLEDLFVAPEHRGLGAGKALLQKLAQIAVAEQCGRLEWSVLDWNTPAIDFYCSLGAVAQDEWTRYRLSGEALLKLGSAQ